MKTLVKRFKKNLHGKDFIVGDIHGHFTKLQSELDEIGFDGSKDRLFSVGDLVDRGPESSMAMDWLYFPWFHAVQGNHEDMAISFEQGHGSIGNYAANGGAWNIANDHVSRRSFALAFAEMPVAIELETENGIIGIVHAEVPAPSWGQFVSSLESPLTSEYELNSLVSMAQWSRNRIAKKIETQVGGVLAVVVGHTPIYRVEVLGNVIFIDTGGWLGRKFTILDASTIKAAT